ncbi:iron uptake porin [Calothrix sp. 336/3]|uniref:iron uptake porin n=1 Tax=Calothrix sp. 336/3 TaxID=1337936 RepID=UPI0006246E94|nr:iron uptake porin [Calothrix sp. 336/3]AKG23793.1 S-layer protein [Calothrix sp. 336/3]
MSKVKVKNGKVWVISSLIAAGIYGVPQQVLAEEIPTLEVSELSTDQLTDGTFTSISSQTSDFPTLPDESMDQVTSVSQLRDVQPTDWAFQALQSLVERYGCIAGYPDGTYRGQRAITRYEFAAGLNNCLERIDQLIKESTQSFVQRQDLETLQKLQSEFAAELTALRGRVDKLEAQTAEIAANQFSTTTKLTGVTVVGVQARSDNRGDINPRNGVKDTDDAGTNANVIYLNQLFLTTQFSPSNFLVTGLLTANGSSAPRFPNYPRYNHDVLLGYELSTNGDVTLSDLHYHQMLTDKLAMMVGAAGVDIIRAFRGPNRVESGATGPISVFAQRNPILNMGYSGAGIAFDWQFAKSASLQAIYNSTSASNPGKGKGLFNGNYTAAAQLLFTPSNAFDISLYYVNSYSSNGYLSKFAGDDCLTAINCFNGTSKPLQTNAVGASVNWQLSSRVNLGGWAGYTNSYIPGRSGNVETTNYMVYLNFPDLFAKGNLAGIYFGQPPKITNSDLPVGFNVPDLLNGGVGNPGSQPGTTNQIEAFYRFRVSDNISVTPGIIHIWEPGHTPENDPITVGVLRTSFSF